MVLMTQHTISTPTAAERGTANASRSAEGRFGLAKAIAVAAIAASIVNGLIAFLALGPFGASEALQGLTAPAFVSLTVIGVAIGALGWRAITRRAKRPATVMRRLVPTVLVLSFIPDVLLLTSGAPGADLPGVLALMAMHVVVVAVAVPVFQHFMPARD
jgi:hypothetical protein